MKYLGYVIFPILIVIAAYLPMFIMASSIDADEFQKSGLGAGSMAVIGILYKMWDRYSKDVKK